MSKYIFKRMALMVLTLLMIADVETAPPEQENRPLTAQVIESIQVVPTDR